MILIQLGTIRLDSYWTCYNGKSLESGLMQGCWYNVGFVDVTLDQCCSTLAFAGSGHIDFALMNIHYNSK